VETSNGKKELDTLLVETGNGEKWKGPLLVEPGTTQSLGLR